MERIKLIKTGLAYGVLFAFGMAIYNFISNEPFSIGKFLFHGSFFGIFMVVALKFNFIKEKK